MSKKSRWLKVVLSASCCSLLASGCTRVTFKDSVDLTLDFSPLVGPSDQLHTPYVDGAELWIYIESSSDNERYADWRLSSSDPTVFAVQGLVAQKGFAMARGQALRPGRTTLVVTDGGGSIVGSEVVEVERPDEVRLLAHGLLLLNRPDDEAEVRALRVVQGGTGTYLARYFRAGQPLFGNGALSAASDDKAAVQIEQSFLFEDRDWLQVSPSDAQNHDVRLFVNGTPHSTVTLSGVAPADVTSVRILGEDESRAKKDEMLTALALASDRSGQAVYGVEYQWQLGEAMQAGLGDLFRYRFDPSRPQLLTARSQLPAGSMMAQAMIRASRGFVDSSNRVGCGASPAAPGSGSAWLALLALAPVAALARRRRSDARRSA